MRREMLAGSRSRPVPLKEVRTDTATAYVEGPGRLQSPLHILVIGVQGRASAGQGQPEVMAPLLMGLIMVLIMHAWEREWGQLHKEMT